MLRLAARYPSVEELSLAAALKPTVVQGLDFPANGMTMCTNGTSIYRWRLLIGRPL